jgi:N-methylhydantoinase A
VSPEFREYERMVTTVVEAFLEPVCAPTSRVASLAPGALVMTSAGGLIPVGGTVPRASLLLSGPAGGVPRPRSRPRAVFPTR